MGNLAFTSRSSCKHSSLNIHCKMLNLLIVDHELYYLFNQPVIVHHKVEL